MQSSVGRAPANPIIFLCSVALLLFLARLAIVLNVDLFHDETAYVWLGIHSPFEFTPGPPGTALLVRAGMFIWGKTEVGVRFFSLVFSTLTLVPVYLLARALGGTKVAVWSILAVAATPLYFAFGILGMPDGVQLFFWSLALYFTFVAITSTRLTWWVLAGISVGLGLYFKYILILYFPSLFLCLLLSPTGRSRLRSKGPYVAGMAAFLVFMPVALWAEYASGWNTLRYNLSERLFPQSPSLADVMLYQLIHAATISPLLYIACLLAVVWAGIQAVRSCDARLAFLFSFSAVTYTFFAVAAASVRRLAFRTHWDAIAYVPALIAAVVMFHTWYSARMQERRGSLLRAVGILALAFGLGMNALIVLEIFTGWASKLVGQPAFFYQVLGWQAMAREADTQLAALPGPESGFFLGVSYHTAVEYAFYGRHTGRVYALEHPTQYRYGMNSVLQKTGYSQEYLFREHGKHGVVVAVEIPRPGRRSKKETDQLEWKLAQICSQAEEMPPVEISYYGRVVKVFRIYRCLGFDNIELGKFISLMGGPGGTIDTSEPRGGMLVVQGWAVERESGAPVARVEVRIDGMAVGDAKLGLARPDVRDAFGREDMLLSGWRLEVDLGKWSVGEHRVTAVAFNRVGTSRALSNPQSFTVSLDSANTQ